MSLDARGQLPEIPCQGPFRITVLNYTVYCTGLDDRKKGKNIVPFQLYKTYG